MTPTQKLLAAFEARIATYNATSIRCAVSIESRLASAALTTAPAGE